MKYILEIEATKTAQETQNYEWGYSTSKVVNVDKEISEQEIYEAVAKYCMVKGFSTSALSVKSADRDAVETSNG